jgi:hypothetical protein
MNYDFLKAYPEDAMGPVQQSEALLLYALTVVVRPKLVLELGSQHGQSTRCFLEAGAERVIAVDIAITPELRRLTVDFAALKIVPGSQESFSLECLNDMSIDLLFIDASHNFELDCRTFQRLQSHFSPGATIVVHDTGQWAKRFMRQHHFDHVARFGKDLGDTCVHQPDVMRFVSWLKDQGMDCISLASENCLRHGLSLFQFPE